LIRCFLYLQKMVKQSEVSLGKYKKGEAMRVIAWVLMVVMVAGVAGCAKKTASEQLRTDMKKAGNQMDKELDSWK